MTPNTTPNQRKKSGKKRKRIGPEFVAKLSKYSDLQVQVTAEISTRYRSGLWAFMGKFIGVSERQIAKLIRPHMAYLLKNREVHAMDLRHNKVTIRIRIMKSNGNVTDFTGTGER